MRQTYALLLDLLLALGCLSLSVGAAAPPKMASEYSLKAAYIYNFLHFIAWPEQVYSRPKAAIAVGIAGAVESGDAPFVSLLQQVVKSEKINQCPILVSQLAEKEKCQECQVLFIARGEEERVEEYLSKTRGLPVLTIGEVDGFCQRGGMINFVKRSGRIAFQINHEAAKKAGLKISSELLRLAEIIQENPDTKKK